MKQSRSNTRYHPPNLPGLNLRKTRTPLEQLDQEDVCTFQIIIDRRHGLWEGVM